MSPPSRNPAELAAEILRLAQMHADMTGEANRPAELREGCFEPGKTPVPYAARVFTGEEVAAAVKSSLE